MSARDRRRMKTPKPVKAWAIDVEGDPIDIQDLHHTRREARNEARALSDSVYPMNVRPIRVTIVPDGAASAEAECRRLRRALSAIRRFAMNSELGYATQQFLVTQIDAALARKGRRNG